MLPKDLTLAYSLESFKINIDKLLPSFKDTSPISGDDTKIPNLLLDRPGKQDNRMLPGGRLYNGLVNPSPTQGLNIIH